MVVRFGGMNKVWEYFIDIFIGVSIIFIAVLIYFGLRTETVVKSLYEHTTDEFIIKTKRSGLITVKDYEDYLKQMGIGNNLFDIRLEHSYKIYEPEYRFKAIEEIVEEQNRGYSGSNDYHYREVITERPHVDDPINDGNLNSETNESILAKAVDGPADPNHVHDENCYTGHRHKGSPAFVHSHKHDSKCVEFTSSWYKQYNCRNCGQHNLRFLVSYYWDEESKSVRLGMSNGGTAECMACGSRNLSNMIDLRSYGYSCGYSIDIDGDGYTDAVGRDKTYEYIKAHPQDTSVRSTHLSGCYKYHRHITFPCAGYNYGGIPYYTQSSLYEAATVGLNSYCELPEFYHISWTAGGSGFNFTYKAVVRSNNSISLVFSGASGYGVGRSEPRVPFPETITLREFARLLSSRNAERFFNKHYGITFGDFSGRYKASVSLTGELDLCDETIYNRWHTTCGLEEDDTVDCNSIIRSLVPTHSNQTVYANDPLITTATATYKDGSTKLVVCTTDFLTSNLVKDKSIVLTYTYSIEGETHSISCTIKVTVIPRNETCPKGHLYNLNTDGSDPGCPYCQTWIEDLQVFYPTSPIVITIGTTLKDNNLILLATYMDGHKEEVTSGYIDNLDTNYLGTKPVTIGYKGATVTVLVTTVCATMVCDICGYEYNLYPDGTNPGCPRCIAKIPVFTGNIMEYEHVSNTDEILQSLYEDGQYFFYIGDSFTIRVINKSSSVTSKLLKKIYPSINKPWFMIEKSEYVMTK